MPDPTDAELDRLVERLSYVGYLNDHSGDWGPRNPDGEQAAAAITALRARITELEADRAEWVEVERLRMGKQ